MVFILSALWWIRIRTGGSFLMGGTGCWGIWVLLCWAGPCSVNHYSNFLLIGGAVFPPCTLAWGQTMVGNDCNDLFHFFFFGNDLLQKDLCQDCWIQCPWPHGRPLLTRNSAGGSWTLTGKSGIASCGLTTPVCWLLVLFVPSKSLFHQSS